MEYPSPCLWLAIKKEQPRTFPIDLCLKDPCDNQPFEKLADDFEESNLPFRSILWFGTNWTPISSNIFRKTYAAVPVVGCRCLNHPERRWNLYRRYIMTLSPLNLLSPPSVCEWLLFQGTSPISFHPQYCLRVKGSLMVPVNADACRIVRKIEVCLCLWSRCCLCRSSLFSLRAREKWIQWRGPTWRACSGSGLQNKKVYPDSQYFKRNLKLKSFQEHLVRWAELKPHAKDHRSWINDHDGARKISWNSSAS